MLFDNSHFFDSTSSIRTQPAEEGWTKAILWPFAPRVGSSETIFTPAMSKLEIVSELKKHVGDSKKFVRLADAIRTACRKMLDQLDEIDARHGR